MIKSMTGYGRYVKLSSLGKWLIEIHSVNKKALDFNLFIPRDLLQFDVEVRKWLAPFLKRGHVTVKVSLHRNEGRFDWEAQLNTLLSLKQGMERVCLQIGCSKESITFPFLYEELKSISSSDLSKEEESIRQELKEGVEKALEACLQMKEMEGLALAESLRANLFELERLTHEIESLSLGVSDRYRHKIQEKLSEFKDVLEQDKERVLREVFFYAEKVDISEEIVRLHSHIDQFRQILNGKEESVGRTMDFLIQEMGREANTIASKSAESAISYVGLKMKGEIEKIREQAQNVE